MVLSHSLHMLALSLENDITARAVDGVLVFRRGSWLCMLPVTVCLGPERRTDICRPRLCGCCLTHDGVAKRRKVLLGL